MVQQEVDLGGAEGKDTLDESFTSHFSVGVCSEDIDCAVCRLSHKIDCATLVCNHSLSYYFNTFGDGHFFELYVFLQEIRIELFQLIFLCFRGWTGESKWQLRCWCDTIEDNAVVVLSDKRHVHAAVRSELNDYCLLDAVVAHSRFHACLVGCGVEYELHRLGEGVDCQHVKDHIPILAATFIITRTKLSGQESNFVACLCKGNHTRLNCVSFILEANIFIAVEVGKTNEFTIFYSVQLEEVNLIWTSQTLNHNLSQSSVGCDNRVAHHHFLSPYFSWVVQVFFFTLIFLIEYVRNHGVGIKIFVCGRLANGDDTFHLMSFYGSEPAVLYRTFFWVVEFNRREEMFCFVLNSIFVLEA